jgi:mono/diheme cytochrome c family protein
MAKTKEKDVLLDHNFDGIQELDNDLPPWWLWLFYITIIFGVIYMVHYHVIGTGDLSAVEYQKEMDPNWEEVADAGKFSIGYHSPFYKDGEELTPLTRVQIAIAREKQEAILAAEKGEAGMDITLEGIGFEEIILAAMKVANAENLEKLKSSFPEIWSEYQKSGVETDAFTGVGVESAQEDIEPLTDAASLTAGESIFVANCATCHGKQGEGGIGPNMTDEYFMHGHTVGNTIAVIKNGVPAKGMISWRGILNEDQILQVASYIQTLIGTNPPNAKAPQGEKVNLSAH